MDKDFSEKIDAVRKACKDDLTRWTCAAYIMTQGRDALIDRLRFANKMANLLGGKENG